MPSRRTFLVSGAAAVPASVFGAALTAAPADAAPAEPTPADPLARSKKKPTVVFVHGAFADASGWDSEVRTLSRMGYPVYAPANPLRGLTADADYIRAFLQTVDGPVVLVGHSYGGAVITNAARGVDAVKALVYISAFALENGESCAQASDPTKYRGSLLGPDTLTVRPVPNAAAPGGTDEDLYIAIDSFRAVFAADQSPQAARTLALTQRPLSSFAFNEPSGEPAWKTVPSWALVSLEDRAIGTEAERAMAQRAKARITYVHAAHDSLITRPNLVVRLVLDAVRTTR